MKNITQIEYNTGSGPVSPEYQYHETIIITSDKVTFNRSGNDPDTLINTGTWTIPVNKDEIVQLFASLESVNISDVKRIKFKDPLVGAGYKSYTISYENNKSFFISNDGDGETKNFNWIADPVKAFLQQVDFPEDAVERDLLN